MGTVDRVVGYREHVFLPDLQVRLVAKVDTGARSSCLHARRVTVRSTPAGIRVRAEVPLDRAGADHAVLDAPLVGWRWVRDSGGHGGLRPVVEVSVTLGPWSFREVVTLADRPGLRHRMLLGRVAVRGRFLVDPGRSFVVGQPSSPSLRLAPVEALDGFASAPSGAPSASASGLASA